MPIYRITLVHELIVRTVSPPFHLAHPAPPDENTSPVPLSAPLTSETPAMLMSSANTPSVPTSARHPSPGQPRPSQQSFRSSRSQRNPNRNSYTSDRSDRRPPGQATAAATPQSTESGPNDTDPDARYGTRPQSRAKNAIVRDKISTIFICTVLVFPSTNNRSVESLLFSRRCMLPQGLHFSLFARNLFSS